MSELQCGVGDGVRLQGTVARVIHNSRWPYLIEITGAVPDLRTREEGKAMSPGPTFKAFCRVTLDGCMKMLGIKPGDIPSNLTEGKESSMNIGERTGCTAKDVRDELRKIEAAHRKQCTAMRALMRALMAEEGIEDTAAFVKASDEEGGSEA